MHETVYDFLVFLTIAESIRDLVFNFIISLLIVLRWGIVEIN